MKLIRISFAALLALAVGASVPAFAQHGHDGDSRHEKNKDKGKNNDNGSRHGGGDRQPGRDWRGDRGHGADHARREDHDRHEVRDRREDHDRHEAREWHGDRDRHEAREFHEDHGRHEGWDHDRRDWGHERREHEEWAELHHRHYIREDRFVAYFGYGHRFRIVRPVIVAGHARFRYGGYWFVLARPLPPGWDYDDDVYVDYIDDGYYMCSPAHPGIRISVDIQ